MIQFYEPIYNLIILVCHSCRPTIYGKAIFVSHFNPQNSILDYEVRNKDWLKEIGSCNTDIDKSGSQIPHADQPRKKN